MDGKNSKRAGLILLSLILIFLGRFFPRPAGMPASAMQVFLLFIGTLILWLKIGVHWPSALCLGALAFIPELNFSKILAGSVGSQIVTFLIFTFMCSYTLARTPFMKRVAVWFITRKLARRSPWWFCTFYFMSMMVAAWIMSPTVLFVTYIAISEEIFAMLHLEKGSRLASMIMVGQTMACCLGSGMTPIAHDGPILGLGLYEAATGQNISYTSYMGACMPVGILVFILMLVLFRFLLKPDMSPLADLDINKLTAGMPPVGRKESIVCGVFLCVVALWVLPSLTMSFLPGISKWISSFGITMPPLLGTIVLCILTDEEGKPLMDYSDALAHGVSWVCVIMSAAVLALSSALSNSQIGFTTYIGAAVKPLIAGVSPLVCVFLLILLCALMTNICSNLVSITLVLSIGLPLFVASGGTMNGAALAALVSYAGAFAVATPSAQPLVAIGIGQGFVRQDMLLKYGYLVVVLSAILAAAIGYPLASAFMAGMV
ncbi:SLC13 family permease [Acidaminococcus massiliensis]|uniref:SLC13 family permease n=1 Tax=Acidaminococcus massiliensis TaxID=1852375 RepID=UPI00248E9C98|nr:SLC13 family permease [Acidaminococcus massiliensis]